MPILYLNVKFVKKLEFYNIFYTTYRVAVKVL
jgi:hypothetical protein